MADEVIAVARSFDIDAKVVGCTEPTERPDGANHLLIRRGETQLAYTLDD